MLTYKSAVSLAIYCIVHNSENWEYILSFKNDYPLQQRSHTTYVGDIIDVNHITQYPKLHLESRLLNIYQHSAGQGIIKFSALVENRQYCKFIILLFSFQNHHGNIQALTKKKKHKVIRALEEIGCPSAPSQTTVPSCSVNNLSPLYP